MEFYNWMQNDTHETSACLKDQKGCGIIVLIHKTYEISNILQNKQNNNILFTLPSTHKDVLLPTAAALLEECSASANSQILVIQLVVPPFY
jgi:hypothetical protein